MKEFGSDFHRCDFDLRAQSNYYSELSDTRFYACGRHAIDSIVAQEGWKRIWIPAYFCYDVIGHIKDTSIEVVLYDDDPLREDDEQLVRNLPYQDGDVLLRMNFFGLRGKRINDGISVPVIEDHTHDLISPWALSSDADWCIASIRKSLPVAAGGILWSPKNKQLPDQIASTKECEQMADIRYEGMRLKREYLRCEGPKGAFREKYLQSEDMIEELRLSGMDKESYEISSSFMIKRWTDLRVDNWQIANNLLNEKFTILKPKEDVYWQPFSLIILCDSVEERDALRQHLMKNCIYPAILWQVPEGTKFADARDFSQRMLSVHCDMRYSRTDIESMCQIINSYYD